MHEGTAHGAYISGIREATKLLSECGVCHRWEDSCFLNQDVEKDFIDDNVTRLYGVRTPYYRCLENDTFMP